MGKKIIFYGDESRTVHADFQVEGGATACNAISSGPKAQVNEVVSCQNCMRVLTAAKEYTCIGNGWV